MFKHTVKYADWNGVEKERDLYFNLTQTELNKLQMAFPGGLDAILDRIVKAKDNVEILKMFDIVVERSYGVKSDDGERFMKGPEVYRTFEESMAYDEFFKWLTENEKNAATFFNSIIPQSLKEEVEKQNPQLGPGTTTPIK